MYQNFTQIRVRYAETDQMGVVYYGIYPQYFEVGRVESLRALGITYKEMEESGYMLPVSELTVKYLKPALYDDLLHIHTQISKWPSTKLIFEHVINNNEGVLLAKGVVELVFVDHKKRRPIRPPHYFLDILKPYFQ